MDELRLRTDIVKKCIFPSSKKIWFMQMAFVNYSADCDFYIKICLKRGDLKCGHIYEKSGCIYVVYTLLNQ